MNGHISNHPSSFGMYPSQMKTKEELCTGQCQQCVRYISIPC
ncbi:EPS8 isoform 4 [Pan troglodytes]|uniref:EGFR pathway substrate 8, signaling adaptor n=2 Tax=Homininae TaxID=207598 RepID=F5H714_HUMAN|nr:EPS8 isoform 4 [Pan troglodytes]